LGAEVNVQGMQEHLVGSVEELADGVRLIIAVDDREISVFQNGGDFYAFENRCLHQGGPVGEGTLIPKVEAVVGPDKDVEERFDESVMHIVCPWHGWEYELKTGECSADRRLRLASFEVRVKEGNVYVVA
jgi:nitrite reductase/ring-hydroxylating ferredoxin subunit